ncbi:type III secretion system export apparatus subunit SctT [Scandinavium sp. V105_16]|uniref:Type III secretion system export apparatus subunit SctT n=1 Tax=Scandinavium lactucae TaxID=3095028 RepID=A0AAJ2S6H5_9ENTR|nr:MULTISPECIES: type III secretion system export apparatus subunit SctT [unclassified Scandinavium]MDX6019792.1 type III secretion system export apparatus subunit SctT [Scandinavium sp. V105_16]MDX6032814.1 type III secretion system export apparatus subunit SctT [Scandinavium sp. V105_12]MDX6039938.1 type III secretion system export apparatus subunit SctT [Scandinavium sp. V105_6]MDX6051874.1 type III secretion system export apparatus subunit SctT [Scandinavium sp. V105_1]
MYTLLFYDLHRWLYEMAMASARVMPAFILLPFFNSSTLTGAIRMPVAMLVGVSLWPYSGAPIAGFDNAWFLIVIAKELMLGLIIAFFLCLPCWVLHATGSFIDNQRGATLSSSIDPLSGVDTSELANFFNLFAAVVVLQNGGLLLLLEVFERSYLLWAPYQMEMPGFMLVVKFITLVISHAVVLASPLIIIFLLTELCLGLLARFAPQLNAFALALTVKSIIAFFLLLLYFTPIIPGKIMSLQIVPDILNGWSVKTIY